MTVLRAVLVLLCASPGPALAADPSFRLTGHTDDIESIDWSADGSLLASCDKNAIRTWRATGELVNTGLAAGCDQVRFSPNKLYLVTFDRGYSPPSISLRAVHDLIRTRSFEVTDFGFADSETLIGRNAVTFDVYDFPWGGLRRSIKPPAKDFKAGAERINFFAFAVGPDGLFATSDAAKRLVIWKGKKQKVIIENAKSFELAFAPDGETIAAWTEQGVRTFRTKDGKAVAAAANTSGALRYSPDGSILAIGRNLYRATDLHRLSPLSFGPQPVAFSPDGKLLARTGDLPRDKTIEIWRIEDLVGDSARAPVSTLSPADVELFTAVRAGRVADLDRILKSGARLDAREADGSTPILAAAEARQWESVRALARKGARLGVAKNLSSPGAQWSLLAMCVVLGADEPLLRELVSLGADLNAPDEQGRTPLMWASHDPAKLRLLLRLGARTDVVDDQGVTPLFFTHDPESIRILLDAGASVDARDKGGVTLLMHVAGRQWTPTENDADLISFLVERGASLEAKSTNGFTPLLWAARFGRTEVVARLLLLGSDTNATGHDGETALMTAAAAGHLETIEMLVANGADLASKDHAGTTALMHAERSSRSGAAAILRALELERAADTARASGNTGAALAAYVAALSHAVPGSATEARIRARAIQVARSVGTLRSTPEVHTRLAAAREAAQAAADPQELGRARRELHAALRLAPWHAPAWFNLALVEESAGNDAAAVIALRQCLEAKPDGVDAEVSRTLERLRSKQRSPAGIGARLKIEKGIVTVVESTRGSPAAWIGLRAGDRIIELDGAPISSLSEQQVLDRIGGDSGTFVRLTAIHKERRVRLDVLTR